MAALPDPSNFQSLRERVLHANLLLPQHGLVKFTWGNVSEIDRAAGVVAIKPSGVEYDRMSASDIVLVTLGGQPIGGHLRPSSDLDTHLELYRRFPQIGGVVHTHSNWATTLAQNGRGIPAFGTTQADYFYGEIPCTRPLSAGEIQGAYELETGRVIVETFRDLDPQAVPGVLVYGHGPFAWGEDAHNAVHNMVVLEEVARMAWHNLLLDPALPPLAQTLLDKHYQRKHGPGAYYGQRTE